MFSVLEFAFFFFVWIIPEALVTTALASTYVHAPGGVGRSFWKEGKFSSNTCPGKDCIATVSFDDPASLVSTNLSHQQASYVVKFSLSSIDNSTLF